MRITLLFCLVAAPAFAECPDAPDHRDALDSLIEEVQDAGSDREARPIANAMWELWTDAPDEPAQTLLDTGMQARSSYDFLGAIDAFDRLVEYCPDYAEGYNQRAFVNFLRQDYESALPDLDAALERDPRHVAALSGKALTLFGLGRENDARRVLREALELNPWLSERHLLDAPGVDL